MASVSSSVAPPALLEPSVPADAPAPEAIDALHEDGLSWVIERAIARGELPGCVVAVGQGSGLVYLRAFGERTRGEPMTLDTRFDLASLTKAVATATSVMALVEQGAVDLDARVASYLPELALPDKRAITVRELLLHTSGLPKVSPLSMFEQGAQEALRHIARAPLESVPGQRFEYSDLGYFVLGQLVERVSGKPLDVFARERIFAPLGMRDTRFTPPPEQALRTAPTEERDEQVIRGVVDDPRAYRVGGVAGHAGLFSTATDLARFARMILHRGELDGVRVLSEETVARMIAPERAGEAKRALGWDVDSSYALARGALFSSRAFGHGGYTGTSLWIDPERDLYVLILSNRVHVGPKGTIHPLASSLGDIAASALDAQRTNELELGIDVLSRESFARLRGRSIAVLTHAAARDKLGTRTLDRLLAAPQIHVRAVLAPEHGLGGDREGHVQDAELGGMRVFSLFGKTRRPTREMLANVDTIVIDLVDVGTRFYTYMSTVLATLETASELGLDVVLLDRPNPLDGVHVEGPVSEPEFASFVNYHPLPLRHGMTAGELAHWLADERKLSAPLHVVRVEHWRRDAWIGDTELAWVPPSPNLRTKDQAMLYPAVALVEGTNVSVGRGTAQAFAVVGAPFISSAALTAELAREGVSGVEISPTRFRPTIGPYAHQMLPGVALKLVDPHAFSAAHLGLALIRALWALYPNEWDATRLEKLVAHRATLAQLGEGRPLGDIEASWRSALEVFAASRQRTLLY